MLTPWKESYDQPWQHIKKQRRYFANKGPSSQSYGFSRSHAERWRVDAFELWCWRRLLRVPWTARRSNQSILKEISPEYSLEGMMLEAEAPILWPPDGEELTHLKKPWCWERLKAGGEGDDRGWDGWMASLTLGTWVWVNSGSWWWTGRPGVLQSMGSQSWTRLSDWTELNCCII